ncbi:hypothetical protein ElyMa_001858500 [Elysia marginata]|uniref:Uncharacterized protein n=1 Tax=Elysia marginata TaxID=1093978 RepID=A0AAV4EMI9_9GAST|nr:hypothetical protein ElyMa_001858500 [Elysia marginata]
MGLKALINFLFTNSLATGIDVCAPENSDNQATPQNDIDKDGEDLALAAVNNDTVSDLIVQESSASRSDDSNSLGLEGAEPMERSLSFGSWVIAMFPGKKGQKKFLGTVPRIKEGKDFLDMWCEDPSKVAHPEQNIFGEPLNPSNDPVLSALIGAENITLTNVLSKLLTAIRSVYVRQLTNRKKIASAVKSALSTNDFSASLTSFKFPEETLYGGTNRQLSQQDHRDSVGACLVRP